MDQQTLYYVLIILVALSTILPVLTSYVNRKRQQKALEEQLEKRQRYLSTLQAGDEVILFSGLHGKIIKLTDSLVELQIAEGVLFTLKKSIMGKAKNYFLRSSSSFLPPQGSGCRIKIIPLGHCFAPHKRKGNTNGIFISQSKQHYGIRKYKVGVCSALIALSILGTRVAANQLPSTETASPQSSQLVETIPETTSSNDKRGQL